MYRITVNRGVRAIKRLALAEMKRHHFGRKDGVNPPFIVPIFNSNKATQPRLTFTGLHLSPPFLKLDETSSLLSPAIIIDKHFD